MASKITLGSFMNSSADGCVPVGTPVCFNLKKGYCRFGDKCHFSHSASDIPWKLTAILNLNRGVVWFHIGKKMFISQATMKNIEKVIGTVKRVDFVRMPGNAEKGGQFWCAVFHFNDIQGKAYRTIASGKCIRFEKGIRAQLFRSEIKPEEEIRAKQAADEAALQCLKTVKATTEVLNTMNVLMKHLFRDIIV
jgi:hypothetical protein